METRKYTLRRRAEKQDETRARIVDAAMALHEEIGPANTTVSAVAERAGVQRLTVYRHFPSDFELFGACTTKWLTLNPPPDLVGGIGDQKQPADRTAAAKAVAKADIEQALTSLYRYYRRTARMWTAAYRDLERVPALAEPMAAFAEYLTAVQRALLARAAPTKTRKRETSATLAHAVQFATWRSLSDQRLADAAIARLVTSWAIAE